MSYELTLLPLRSVDEINRPDPSGTYPHSRLKVQQNYGIIGQIIDLSSYRSPDRLDIPEAPHIKTQPVPEGFWLCNYTEEGIEKVRTNPYDDVLVWGQAADFKQLVVPSDGHPLHKALKAYIDELPDDTPIVVWLD